MRVDEMSDGRLVELLTQHFLEHDPMPEVAIVPPAVLAEVARRTLTAEDLLERRKKQVTGP